MIYEELLKEIFPVWQNQASRYNRRIPSHFLTKPLDLYWEAYYYMLNNSQTEQERTQLAIKKVMLNDFFDGKTSKVPDEEETTRAFDSGSKLPPTFSGFFPIE